MYWNSYLDKLAGPNIKEGYKENESKEMFVFGLQICIWDWSGIQKYITRLRNLEDLLWCIPSHRWHYEEQEKWILQMWWGNKHRWFFRVARLWEVVWRKMRRHIWAKWPTKGEAAAIDRMCMKQKWWEREFERPEQIKRSYLGNFSSCSRCLCCFFREGWDRNPPSQDFCVFSQDRLSH